MRRWKWTKWEFWPFWLFYIPVYLFVLFKGFLLRKSTFFLAANPGMPVGGFVEYPKEAILRHFPSRYLPKTILLKGRVNLSQVLSTIEKNGLRFPVILKPNVGERGYAVEKICSQEELKGYLNQAPKDLILQEYIPWRAEYGVMCVQFPWSNETIITSMVIKEPLIVYGDGRRTLLQLMQDSVRASYHIVSLKKLYAEKLEWIPAIKEEIVLVEIGNHNRGFTFLDGSKFIDSHLVGAFRPLVENFQGFHIGRFDVKAKDLEALKRGEFKIIELNGVNSEPAHIYDPNMGIFQGWKDLLSHWQWIYRISRYHLRRGVQVMDFNHLRALINQHYKDQKKRGVA